MAKMIGPRKIRSYGHKFKATAVKLSHLPGVQVQDVAEALDIHPFMLSRWRKEYREGLIVDNGKSDVETPVKATGGNMLISEIQGWHYFITWDNPVPADSSAMLEALGALGKITELQTKTTVARSPRASTKWRDVRNAIKSNLHPKKGNAIYVNVRSGKGFQIGSQTKHLWKQVP